METDVCLAPVAAYIQADSILQLGLRSSWRPPGADRLSFR